ncbi:GNAT family N-acetyltransferase [Brasilonema octagenarum]|uniref:GNAT family N-acetyltransferase n=1 Tax=Brasilonema octagenarum UFV-OR1 TaxID=417115 RepID=A0ABX1M200_9CYAN|nr:GNAT family N-acetyltransferase [Brasilonema octagenarum]NMF61810.1 GNAT family N-acetyltransferase [Brasilonema octagenarum UFV-OR1]
MMPKFEYSQLIKEDIQRLGNILEQCFLMSPGDSEIFINRTGLENFYVLRAGKQVAGGLATILMPQWWGGERVLMAGIAAVGIAPEYRGDGAALTMMQHTVKELHAKGVPISTLYPATQRLYRKAGYEQGGISSIWEVPTQSILVKEQPLAVGAVAGDHEIFRELYQQQAKLNNGFVERHQSLWERIFKPDEKETIYAYLIGCAEQPQGYIIISQHQDQDGSFIKVRDFVVMTTAAAQTFWNFLAKHRSQIQNVRWKGSATESLTLLLPEQTAKQKSTSYWMLRVIDVVKALEKRGYPPGIQAELHLEIQDDLLAENNGKFILSVANGRGEVTSGGKGEMKLDIRGLAPLYTGLFTPQQLQLAGQLDATETARFAATQIFAGTAPWMADFF